VKKFKTVKKTDEQIKREQKKFEQMKQAVGSKMTLKVNSNKRAVKKMLLDNHYNLWIETIGEKSEDNTTYFDILDANGKYMGRIATGKQFFVWTVKNGYLYCIEDNEDDGYCLYKYKIIKE